LRLQNNSNTAVVLPQYKAKPAVIVQAT
jgi:hypothetical protein